MMDDYSISYSAGESHYCKGKYLDDMIKEMCVQLGIDYEYNYQIVEHYLIAAHGYFDKQGG